VDEIRLGFGPREKRRIRIRLAVFVAAIALLAPVVFAGAMKANPVATVIVLAAALGFVAVKQLQYASEATLLTPQGVVLTSWLSRRTILWDQITRVEARRRVAGRTGTPRMFAYLHCADGVAIRVPGLLEARFGLPKQEFQDQLGVLLGRWQQETSRTEPVLVTL
jgi:hypothetical protein